MRTVRGREEKVAGRGGVAPPRGGLEEEGRVPWHVLRAPSLGAVAMVTEAGGRRRAGRTRSACAGLGPRPPPSTARPPSSPRVSLWRP